MIVAQLTRSSRLGLMAMAMAACFTAGCMTDVPGDSPIDGPSPRDGKEDGADGDPSPIGAVAPGCYSGTGWHGFHGEARMRLAGSSDTQIQGPNGTYEIAGAFDCGDSILEASELGNYALREDPSGSDDPVLAVLPFGRPLLPAVYRISRIDQDDEGEVTGLELMWGILDMSGPIYSEPFSVTRIGCDDAGGDGDGDADTAGGSDSDADGDVESDEREPVSMEGIAPGCYATDRWQGLEGPAFLRLHEDPEGGSVSEGRYERRLPISCCGEGCQQDAGEYRAVPINAAIGWAHLLLQRDDLQPNMLGESFIIESMPLDESGGATSIVLANMPIEPHLPPAGHFTLHRVPCPEEPEPTDGE